jgi:hypothetical protein
MMMLTLQQKNKILNGLILLFVFLIFFTSIVLFTIFREGVKCSQNPLVYGVNQYKNPEVYCTCYSKNPSYKGFVVQNDGIYDLYGSSSDPSFFIKSSSDN